MSGRIRTIKPELLEDAKTAALSHLQFRLFVSLLLLADDYGNLRSSPGLIRGNAFWGVDDISEEQISEALSELEDIGLIETYAMRGQTYAHIKNWARHQRVDKPGKPRVPSPMDPEVRPARPWVTYFIRLGETGPVKIGRTFDVEARLRKLQTSAPEKLVVLRVVKADIEAALHQRFSAIRTHGEWFEPAPELLEVIASEEFANDSRTTPVPPAPDLRSPITDLRPPTRKGNGSEPDPIPPPPVSGEGPPEWFGAALETVEVQTGEKLRSAESWLRYSGHRANKGISKTQQDAVYWLTTVMVPEARKERRAEADKRDRDARYDKVRAGPLPPSETQKLTVSEQAELAARVPMRGRHQRGAA